METYLDTPTGVWKGHLGYHLFLLIPEVLSKYFTYFQYPGPYWRHSSHRRCPLFQWPYWKHVYPLFLTIPMTQEFNNHGDTEAKQSWNGCFSAKSKISLKSIFVWRKNRRTLALCNLNNHTSSYFHLNMFLLTTPRTILVLWKWPKYATTLSFIHNIFMSTSGRDLKYWHKINKRLYLQKK